ncbi:Dephospho-CoA kinase [Roseovarius albus]|uniref:Dephospho-CoA kinase n=1 Tax=Roseovarius albus TaxID=1247867 RepID=A0A1X6Z524_9RHOB|nr:dephospho-CoA kinase [Roseovarius albus]SLN40613.1 Dephospho-CoA kinase [Roseovarius albus]
MTFRLGLTGSIGMGKSTTAQLFADEGCDTWDADAAVHRLYSTGGLAVEGIRKVFPEAIEDNAVSRAKLKQIISSDETALKQIEEIVHPLVRADRLEFIEVSDRDIVIFDVPLLFETNSQNEFDAVVCVTAPADVQKQRVLARPGMTEAHFQIILGKQMPDAEKRKRADYIVETTTLEHAKMQVQQIVSDIRGKLSNA